MEPKDTTPIEHTAAVETFSSLYRPALRTKAAIGYLRDHPFCETKEFSTASGLKFYRNEYPELQYLGSVLLTNRTQVRVAYEALRQAGSESERKVSQILYETAKIPGDAHTPVKPLKTSYLDNPFALCCIASKIDFTHLDARDVAGHFDAGKRLKINGRNFPVPFIALLEGGGSGTAKSEAKALRHEEVHSHTNAVRESLVQSGRGDLWGKFEGSGKYQQVRLGREILLEWADLQKKNQPHLIKSSVAWKELRKYVLTNAKDEALTRLIANGVDSLTPMSTRFGNYDYVEMQRLNDRELTDLLWQDYHEVFQREVKSAQRLIRAYQMFGLDERAELLPWILMRVPLGEWTRTLNSLGLTSEAIWLEKIAGVRDRNRTSGGWSRDREVEQGTIAAVINYHSTQWKIKNDQLLIEDLVKCWEDLRNYSTIAK